MNNNNGELGNLKLFKEIYGEGNVTQLTEEQFNLLKPLPLKERLEEMERRLREAQAQQAEKK